MNLRIEQVIDQAYIELNKELPDRYYGQRTVAKKVAELIVKECSQLVATRDPRVHPAPEIYLLAVYGVQE